ncbi:rhomboid family intramembrane serine protease [Sphaerisporangium melleum]|uniref:Rhomboid family intramembrane serine protease n=1 Tax=Sphaerisporangium melleum TaxID=321316 RepID=A0A917VL34_9ACTN|nr:rhomboid family intramembrane serine protease [Sphaerisporangium melleum]GGK95227.1 rhomboid family intramembrane serine protease [Sphaerisporangium melleum]GII73337.1 rhomboid family intramembrane serine protease [Sphaerisporangium melleum]
MNDYATRAGTPAASTGQVVRRRLVDLATGALGAAIVIALLVGAEWAVEIADYILPENLDQYGIRPHDVNGLSGILFAPFLHAGFGHLMANTVPLAILGFLAALRGLGRFTLASLIIIVVSGAGVWLISPPGITLGASGLVFGYFGYVVTRGLFDRHPLDIALGVGVAVLYYSLIEGVLPGQPGISWQAHLFGLVGGVIAAWTLRRRKRAVTPG